MKAAPTSANVPLARIETVGLAGIPNLSIELGPMTALIGPRGSGKSQLLVAIAWLLTGRPTPGVRAGSDTMRVAGLLADGGRRHRVERHLVAGETEPAGMELDEPVPCCTFLRAADRLSGALEPESGWVASAMSSLMPPRTTDASAAEALVGALETCGTERPRGELLLIEEPELLLNPQAQRYLYTLLRRFAEMGNQVVYSTWSADFVDAAHHEEIARLDLRRERTRVRRTDPAALTDAERVRMQAAFDHERSEMFFAQKVVLVEGQTERLSLPFVFRAMGHDPDAEGISIVEMSGKSNLPLAARILRQLAIPFVVVFDADHGADSAELDMLIRNEAEGAPTVRLVPDFEGAAGLAGHDDKVFQAWRRFAHAPPEAIPEHLAEIVRATVAL